MADINIGQTGGSNKFKLKRDNLPTFDAPLFVHTPPRHNE